MKDTRFTELVNLYIDRQISPAETAELEAEIQSNPRRRQVYLQYCRMHHATKLVYESFRAHGEQPATVTQTGTIARFESRKRAVRQRWFYAASGLAAAASLAFVVVRSNLTGSNANAPALAPATAKVAVAQPAAPAVRSTEQPLVKLTVDPAYADLLAALHQQEQRNLLLTQQQTAARLQSLFEDGVFDNRQILPQGQDSRRIYQPKGRLDQRAQAEFTAFQFQR
ncbi:MAG: hypothetical protein HYV95_01465 [Opitutae bacterium]|nr:hypothetical protein [Opitutae bacterium]